jgi:hypothetical protein
VNEFRGYLQVTEENMPAGNHPQIIKQFNTKHYITFILVLKTRKDLPLHCLLFNLADLSLEDLIRSGTKVRTLMIIYATTIINTIYSYQTKKQSTCCCPLQKACANYIRSMYRTTIFAQKPFY